LYSTPLRREFFLPAPANGAFPGGNWLLLTGPHNAQIQGSSRRVVGSPTKDIGPLFLFRCRVLPVVLFIPNSLPQAILKEVSPLTEHGCFLPGGSPLAPPARARHPHSGSSPNPLLKCAPPPLHVSSPGQFVPLLSVRPVTPGARPFLWTVQFPSLFPLENQSCPLNFQVPLPLLQPIFPFIVSFPRNLISFSFHWRLLHVEDFLGVCPSFNLADRNPPPPNPC